ncbi:MAG TPA: secretin N-terminal domain-containing protein, partial [Thermogutta sp.]|nr:secretin N-terminal domain-containing protein [Thermogutta sp.]
RGYDRWRGSDRTTYAHGDNIQLAESGDGLGVMSSSGDSPTGRPWAPVVFVSQESKVVNEGNSAAPPDVQDSSSQQGSTAQTSSEPSPEASAPSETGEKRTTEFPAPLEGPPSAPPVIVAITPEGLVVASQDPEALNQFENLVRRMVSQDVTQYGGPELVVYYLKNSKAESVASILDQILGGGTLTTSGSGGGSLIGEIARAAFGNVGGGLVGSLLGIDTGTTSSTSSTSSTRTTSRIQITPDSRLNALIVQAYPQDLQLIEEILRVLDQPESPQDVAVQPKTIIIPVKNTQAEEIANILRSVYQDRLVTAASANRGPSPQEIIQLLRGGGRGGPGGPGRNQPTEEVQRMSIGVDVRTNSLIISAPERLLNEVRQLVEQLDQKAATDSEETTQVVTLQRASPESVRAALSALLGSGVQIRGSTSSSRVTSSSSTSSSGRSSSFSGRRSSPFGSSSQFGRSSGFSGRSGGR